MRVAIEASMKNSRDVKYQMERLVGMNFQVIVLWDEMWKEFSEYYYQKLFEFQPDEVISVHDGLAERWEIWLDEVRRDYGLYY